MSVNSALHAAIALRREFDAAFASPEAAGREQTEGLVVVRVDRELRVALRLADLAGLHECPAIQSLPGAPPAQLGVAGLRGNLIAVLDLAASLGRPRVAAGRWLALWRADPTVGFSFEALEHFLQVAPGRIRRGAGAAERLAEFVDLDGQALPLVSAAALMAASQAARQSAGNDTVSSE
jgi:purine-binding chemotaxis protein CheW